jgi:hypothetical protein
LGARRNIDRAFVTRNSSVIGIDKYIHLLPDIERPVGPVASVDDLKNSRVHAVGFFTGEGFFGNDERFDA